MMKRSLLFVAVSIYAGISFGLACSNNTSAIDTSGGSLGNYNGSLNDLFPDKVGGFKRNYRNFQNVDINPKPKIKDTQTDSYTENSARCKITLKATNFISAKDAEGDMRGTKSLFSKPGPGKDDITITENSKSKGLIRVGNRVEVRMSGPVRRDMIILWTNGSVLFTLDSSGRGLSNNEERDRCVNEALEFENNFPY